MPLLASHAFPEYGWNLDSELYDQACSATTAALL